MLSDLLNASRMISIGITFLAGASAADGPQIKPVGQAIVVDAAGRKVGGIIAAQIPAQILVEVDGSIFSFGITKDGLSPSGSPLVFATSNCAGTPYIFQAPPDLLLEPSTIGLPGKSLYTSQPGALPQPITIQSFISVPTVGDPFCAPVPPPPQGVPPPGPAFVLPAVRLVDLNQFFTPPFSIRTTP